MLPPTNCRRQHKVGHGYTAALCTLNLLFATTSSPKAPSGDQGQEVDWPRGQQQAVDGLCGCLGVSQIGF